MRYVIVSLAIAKGLAGCKADPPGKLETKIITSAEHNIFIGKKHQRNPLPDTPQTLAEGKKAFSHYCFVCHGLDSQNTGVPFIAHVSPPIPSLASPDVQRYTDGQLKWILDYGIRLSGMPGSKGVLSNEELWSIVFSYASSSGRQPGCPGHIHPSS